MEGDIARIVINEGQIRAKRLELSKILIHDYKDKGRTIIAILNGSLVFLADLIRLNPFPKYHCFDIGDDFVAWYGLDYNNKYRNLPFMGVLKDECYRREGFV